MADQKHVATEAIGQSISVRDSIEKERANDGVDVNVIQRENSVSQSNVASEKIVSDQDGAVTRTQANINTASGNGNQASTKYVSSNQLEDQEGQQSMQAIKQTAVVHSILVPDGVQDDNHSGSNKQGNRENNFSQNTIIGGEQVNNIAQAEDVSNVSIPIDNASTFNKTGENRTENKSSIQPYGVGPDGMHEVPFDQMNSNN